MSWICTIQLIDVAELDSRERSNDIDEKIQKTQTPILSVQSFRPFTAN